MQHFMIDESNEKINNWPCQGKALLRSLEASGFVNRVTGLFTKEGLCLGVGSLVTAY